MKNIKNILSVLLFVVITASALTACADRSSDIDYRADGLQFTLPKSMRQSTSETVYDYYFDNLDSSVIFTAVKLDDEFLEVNNLDKNITLKEYVDVRTKDMDTSKIYLEYDDDRKAYTYRYNYLFENASSETFIYVVVIGEGANMWHIEMYCNYESSAKMLSAFEVWAASIRTYEE